MVRTFGLFVFIGFSLHSFAAVTAVSRHPANVIGPTDDRGWVKHIGPANYSPAEIQQIRNNVGHFVCPGKDLYLKNRAGNFVLDGHGQKIHDFRTATAFLISNDTVVTVADVFFSAQDVKRTENGSWNTCYLQTQGDHPAIYKIKGGDTDIVFGTRTPSVDTQNNYAIVKLTRPVPNAQPFVFLDSAVLKPGDTIFPIASSRADQYWPDLNERQSVAAKKELRDEPLMQSCTIRKIFLGEANVSPSNFFSDCDTTAGAMGGPILQRVEGRLVVMGMTTATGSAPDGTEYSDVVHRVARHVALKQTYDKQTYDGRPYFYKTPDKPCSDRGPRSTIVLIEESRIDRLGQVHPAVFEVVRQDCRTLGAKERIVTNQDYQIDPAHREVVLYKGQKYWLDRDMVSTNVKPTNVLSVSQALHTDSKFLSDLQAAIRKSPVIGAPEPTAPSAIQRTLIPTGK